MSSRHVSMLMEAGVGPVIRTVQLLSEQPAKLAEFRREIDALASLYFESSENVLRQDYLLTRAVKAG